MLSMALHIWVHGPQLTVVFGEAYKIEVQFVEGSVPLRGEVWSFKASRHSENGLCFIVWCEGIVSSQFYVLSNMTAYFQASLPLQWQTAIHLES